MKVNISIERVASSTDLAVVGSNLSTGCKAVYLKDGKKYSRKIYMTNTGKSLDFYIKDNGKNVHLQTEGAIYHLHTYHLTNTLFYIEV